jgi:hypothetical protein
MTLANIAKNILLYVILKFCSYSIGKMFSGETSPRIEHENPFLRGIPHGSVKIVLQKSLYPHAKIFIMGYTRIYFKLSDVSSLIHDHIQKPVTHFLEKCMLQAFYS